MIRAKSCESFQKINKVKMKKKWNSMPNLRVNYKKKKMIVHTRKVLANDDLVNAITDYSVAISVFNRKVTGIDMISLIMILTSKNYKQRLSYIILWMIIMNQLNK